jgi:hypothetical protein
MRKLVTVRTVAELRPIEGADVIELAIIDGWQCVVKKEEFKVGDKGLFFEIDSFLPASDERYKFLEKNFVTWKGRYGARIRTMKLRGKLSQGLLLPLSSFPEIKPNTFIWEKDYAADLGVLKWERDGEGDSKPEKKANWLGKKMKKLKYTKFKPLVEWLERTFPSLFVTNASRPYPSFIPKTDEERIQNLINKFEPDPDSMWLATIKLDGSSMTTYYNRRHFGVCSRNVDLKKDTENQFWATALKYNLERGLKKLDRNIALQGELMGPGIQGNREQLKEFKYFIYKVWDIDAKKYLNECEKLELHDQLERLKVEVDTVPSMGFFSGSDLKTRFPTVDDFLAYAEGPSYNPNTRREGVVFENALTGEKGFKVVSNSYLLEKSN